MGTGLALSRYLCANAVAIRYFAPGTCACTYVRLHLRAPAPTCGINILLTLDFINTHTGLLQWVLDPNRSEVIRQLCCWLHCESAKQAHKDGGNPTVGSTCVDARDCAEAS